MQCAIGWGRAASLSGWVNLALAERAAKDRRLGSLERAIAAYETKFGTITAEELTAQARADLTQVIGSRCEGEALLS